MRIAIDVDGVLRQFHQYAVQRWNREHLTDQRKESDWISYDWFYELVGSKDAAFQWWIDNGVFSHAPLFPDAVGSIRVLSQAGHDCIILSSQMHATSCATQTLKWLIAHNLFGLVKEVHFGHDKNVVDFDVMIDDDPRYIYGALDKAPHICCIVFGAPWNTKLLSLDNYQGRMWYLNKDYWKRTIAIMDFVERRVQDLRTHSSHKSLGNAPFMRYRP